MSGFGGIVASAIGGAFKGLGEGAAVGAKMEAEADTQRQRDEFLAKKQERLQALQQQFSSGESQKQREFLGTEGALNRGAQVEQTDKTTAVQYSAQANQKALAEAQLSEQQRHNKSIEGITASGQGVLQTNDDGELLMVGKNGKAVTVVDADGNVVKSQKDMTAKEQSQVKVLQGLIKEDTELLQKSQLMDPKGSEQIKARISRYTSKIAGILGMGMDMAPAPKVTSSNGGAEAKPWERPWGAR